MTIREISDTIIRGERAIVFPLKLEHIQTVTDQLGNHIIDLRGWDRLQYHENGAQLQDGIGEWIVATLNEAYKKVRTEK